MTFFGSDFSPALIFYKNYVKSGHFNAKAYHVTQV